MFKKKILKLTRKYNLTFLIYKFVFLLMALLLPISGLLSAHRINNDDHRNFRYDQREAQAQLREAHDNMQLYDQAISDIEDYLVFDDGKLSLTIERQDLVALHEENAEVAKIYEELLDSIDISNKLISEGVISSNEIVLRKDLQDSNGVIGENGNIFAACSGYSGVINYWFGPRYYANTCDVQVIRGALITGAGLTGTCAVVSNLWNLPGAVACAIATPILVFANGIILLINGAGGNNGVYFQFSWTYQLSYFWHQ